MGRKMTEEEAHSFFSGPSLGNIEAMLEHLLGGVQIILEENVEMHERILKLEDEHARE